VLRFSYCASLVAMSVAFVPRAAVSQETGAALSPFATFPSGDPQTMAGMSLSLSGSFFALRGGAHMAVQESANSGVQSAPRVKPWGADADALLFLERLSYGDHLTFGPYVFAGLGISAVDSASVRISRHDWSYGSGLSLPLGRALAVFGEARWRMNRYVLPQAKDAPSPQSEARIGLSFHVGGGRPINGEMPVLPSGDGIIPSDGMSSEAVMTRVLSTANRYVGTKYRRGGTSPNDGFDAAGFVRFVFSRFGVILPRTASEQARVGNAVDADWHVIAPGDLLMFKDDDGIHHVAIYAGRNQIIHATQTGGGVRYDDLSTERGQWFLDHLVAARRVTPDLRGLLLDLARGFAGEPEAADEPDRAPRPTSRRRQ